MGAGNSRVKEIRQEEPKIPLDDLFQVRKSICKIFYEKKDEKERKVIENGTRFFMSVNNNLKSLITCYHVLSNDLINKIINIKIHTKKQFEIKLVDRIIEFFEKIQMKLCKILDFWISILII